jgi:hypothetical protein
MNAGNITDLNIAFAADSFSLDQSILINHYPITQDFFMAKFLEASNCIYIFGGNRDLDVCYTSIKKKFASCKLSRDLH